MRRLNLYWSIRVFLCHHHAHNLYPECVCVLGMWKSFTYIFPLITFPSKFKRVFYIFMSWHFGQGIQGPITCILLSLNFMLYFGKSVSTRCQRGWKINVPSDTHIYVYMHKLSHFWNNLIFNEIFCCGLCCFFVKMSDIAKNNIYGKETP